MFNLNERLKTLRKSLNLNQVALGERLNISQAHVSALEKGIKTITDRIVSDYCREFNVNEEWLRTGEGEMFVQSDTFSLDEKAKQHNLSKLEVDIMHGYMMLDAETREKVVAMLEDAVLKKQQRKDDAQSYIEQEVGLYRQELEAEKKGQTLLVSEDQGSSSIKGGKTEESS